MLASDFFTVKQQLCGRFVNFFQGLLTSLSPEVQVVAAMVSRCARSTTGKNLLSMERETCLDPWRARAWQIRANVKRAEAPSTEGWRLQYLSKLLMARKELELNCQDPEEINLINSLCSS